MFHQLYESREPLRGSCRDVGMQLWKPVDGLPKRNSLCGCCRNEAVHRGLPDAARWHVDNAAQGYVVVGIDEQAHVGNEVLDFLALIERKTAVNAIRNAALVESFLEGTALRIGAIKNGEAVPRLVLLVVEPANGFSDDSSLVFVAGSRDDA